jgi:hypothetical protein
MLSALKAKHYKPSEYILIQAIVKDLSEEDTISYIQRLPAGAEKPRHPMLRGINVNHG